MGHLNSIESTINFTVEVESENKIAFLDTEITHQDNGSLSTTVYRKKTHTDQYLSFHSHHPISHKIAVVNTLYSRAESICSTEQELEKERKHVKKVLRNNGYPERILAARTRKKEDKKKDKDTPKCTIVIPYVRNVSECIRRILAPLKIRTCFRPLTTSKRMLVHPKDKIPEDMKRGVVYQIQCGTLIRMK